MDSIRTQSNVNNNLNYFPITSKEVQARRPYSLEYERHKEVDRLCNERKYRANIRRLLHELINTSDTNYLVTLGHAALAARVGCSVPTIQRGMAVLVTDGVISSTPRGRWQDKETNLTTLLFIQPKLPVVDIKMIDDINNLILDPYDHINNKQTYDEYVEVLTQIYSKPQDSVKALAPKPTKPSESNDPSKRVSLKALRGGDPDGEVIRVCMAWLLCEEKTKYAVLAMRGVLLNTEIKNPAGYLAKMARELAKGTWQMKETEMKKPEKSAEQRAQEAALEAELQLQAQTLVDEQMAREGKINPLKKPLGVGELLDLDALRAFEEDRHSRILVKLNELRIEHGIAKVVEKKKHNPRNPEPPKRIYKPAHAYPTDWRTEYDD